MGSDLFIVIIPYPTINEERIKELHDIIENLTPEDYEDVELFGWFEPSELPDELTSDETEQCYSDEKAHLKELISNFDSFDFRRDTVVYSLDELTYIITGGMSWGDDPTDVYNDFCHIANCTPLYNKLHEMAKKDREAIF